MGEVYTSAVQRLLDLPEVFTGSDLTIRFHWTSTTASTYLAKWRRAGLVRSLGGRTDVHMNLVRNRELSPEVALRRAYPRAIKVGVDVLRQAGWTTQLPSFVDVAIPSSSATHVLDGFLLSRRPERWYALVIPGVDKVLSGIDQLRPAWALADMMARARDGRVVGAWLMDPEDLDLDSAFSDKEMKKALANWGLEVADAKAYEALFEDWLTAKKNRSQK